MGLVKTAGSRLGWLFFHDELSALRAAVDELESFRALLDLAERQAYTRYEAELARLREEGARSSSEADSRLEKIDAILGELRLSGGSVAEHQSALPPSLGNMYVAFEEAFRGPSDLIKERARAYLQDVRTLPNGRILDIGCGRGEWLDLLKEGDANAYGIDLNETFVRQCLDRGLDVMCVDARTHLTDLAEGSLAAVTAFHVAEHLSVEELVELIDLSRRALRSGGLLILETPNPENLVVGASTFYIDPTHNRPLHPQFLHFLVEARGLGDVEVRFMRPTEPIPLPDSRSASHPSLVKLVETVNARLHGPQDYAVLARRA